MFSIVLKIKQKVEAVGMIHLKFATKLKREKKIKGGDGPKHALNKMKYDLKLHCMYRALWKLQSGQINQGKVSSFWN